MSLAGQVLVMGCILLGTGPDGHGPACTSDGHVMHQSWAIHDPG